MIPELKTASLELQSSEKQFPNLDGANASKKAAKDRYQLTLYRYLQIHEPGVYQNLSSLNSNKKMSVEKVKEWLKSHSKFFALFEELAALNEKETAFKKCCEWLGTSKNNKLGDGQPTEIADVKTVAMEFLQARKALRDTSEGKRVRAALNPFEIAVYRQLDFLKLATTELKADMLVRQMIEEMKTAQYSDYVRAQAANFGNKWLRKQSKEKA